MLFAVIFCWLWATDAPVRLDPPAYADRVKVQKSARSRPLYSLWRWLNTDSVEERYVTEDHPVVNAYRRLMVLAEYAQAIPTLVKVPVWGYSETWWHLDDAIGCHREDPHQKLFLLLLAKSLASDWEKTVTEGSGYGYSGLFTDSGFLNGEGQMWLFLRLWDDVRGEYHAIVSDGKPGVRDTAGGK